MSLILNFLSKLSPIQRSVVILKSCHSATWAQQEYLAGSKKSRIQIIHENKFIINENETMADISNIKLDMENDYGLNKILNRSSDCAYILNEIYINHKIYKPNLLYGISIFDNNDKLVFLSRKFPDKSFDKQFDFYVGHYMTFTFKELFINLSKIEEQAIEYYSIKKENNIEKENNNL